MSEPAATRIAHAVRTSFLQQLEWLDAQRHDKLSPIALRAGLLDNDPLIAAVLTLATVVAVSRTNLVEASNNIYDAISLLKTKEDDE